MGLDAFWMEGNVQELRLRMQGRVRSSEPHRSLRVRGCQWRWSTDNDVSIERRADVMAKWQLGKQDRVP